MTPSDVARQRFNNQHIPGAAFKKAVDVVGWMGAVQAQDYLGSLWAVGLRMQNAIEADIEQAIVDGTIVRSWPMRGTLHFVAAADIRWMLKLLAPRVIARCTPRYRQLALDGPTLLKCHGVLSRALQGKTLLTRHELAEKLERSGVAIHGQRLIYIIGRAAMEGLICHGARRGKQFTFALLDEWVPVTKVLKRCEALAELARRYFTSHGPATLQDFGWWSGLTMADARAGLGSVESHFNKEIVDGRVHWFARNEVTSKDVPLTAHLLPAFDEFLVGYKDRSAVLDSQHVQRYAQPNTGGMLSPTIVMNGRVVGTWKRVLKAGSVVIAPTLFTSLSKADKHAVAVATHRYGAFLTLPPVLAQ